MGKILRIIRVGICKNMAVCRMTGWVDLQACRDAWAFHQDKQDCSH